MSYFNKKYERIGHLFQDRYFHKIIEDNDYFRNTIRYIHNNPEKAKLVTKEKYEWSSYKEYISNDSSIVDINTFLNELDVDRKVALKKFKEYHSQFKENSISDNIEYELQTRLTDELLEEMVKTYIGLDK